MCGAAPVRQRDARLRTLLRVTASALVGPLAAGRAVGDPQHREVADRVPGRDRLACWRDWRDHGHADPPQRDLLQSSAAVCAPSELSRVEISTPEQRRSGVPGALADTWLADDAWRGRMAAATGRARCRFAWAIVSKRARSVPRPQTSLRFLGFRCHGPVVPGHARNRRPSAGDPELRGVADGLRRPLRRHRHDRVDGSAAPRRHWRDAGRFWFGSLQAPLWTHLPREGVAAQPALDVVVRRPPQLSTAACRISCNSAPNRIARQPAGARDLHVLTSGVGGTGLGDQMALVIPYLVGAPCF